MPRLANMVVHGPNERLEAADIVIRAGKIATAAGQPLTKQGQLKAVSCQRSMFA